MPTRDRYPDSTSPEIEDLRQGTRKQFQSDWVLLIAGAAKTFTHELGEVPWMVDLLQSETNDGKSDGDGNASATLTKNNTTIVVTSTSSDDLYFQVRAL